MQILFINQQRPEYGQSLLYHGLRELGHRVVDYPYNYTLHFKMLQPCKQDCQNGPCTIPGPYGCTNHPAHLCLPPHDPLDYGWDLVVTNNGFGNENLHRALNRAGVPIIALDQGDSPTDSWNAWRKVIGTDQFFFFRREYHEGQPGKPLPYSYYEAIPRPYEKQEFTISFLYRPTNFLRTQLSVELADFPDAFVGEVPHHDYLHKLELSKFSVAVRGAGWDTLRYWEIPSRGAVLCRMPSPIKIPNDFEDGINCIEFTNSDELREKVNHYLNDKMGYNRLRAKSLEHFKKFHTTAARAKYMLKECGLDEE